jgi:hypothetical protein
VIFMSNVSFAEVVIIASTVVALIVIPAVAFALVRRMRVRYVPARRHGGHV